MELWLEIMKRRLFVDDSKRGAKELTRLGFNWNMLDLDIEVTKPQQIIQDSLQISNKMSEKNAMDWMTAVQIGFSSFNQKGSDKSRMKKNGCKK